MSTSRSLPVFPDSGLITQPKPEEASLPELTGSQFELVDSVLQSEDPTIDWGTELEAEGFEKARHGRTREIDAEAIDEEIHRYHRRQRWLLWALIFALVCSSAWAVYEFVWPMYDKLQRTTALAVSLEGQLSDSHERVAALQSARLEDEEKMKALQAELAERHKELEAQEALLIELEDAQATLSEKLKKEIASGDVRIKESRGRLVVDMTDKILFPSGSPELEEGGQAVLRQVADTFRKMSDKMIQVGGHTDSLPISKALKTQFASNWELSAARAVNVVRFLEESCEIPGNRLAAAGHGPFKPVASNSNPKGRQRNRRIEIVLLPLSGVR